MSAPNGTGGADVFVTLRCGSCQRATGGVLPALADLTALRALIDTLHTRATCYEWQTAELVWPDGASLYVDVLLPGDEDVDAAGPALCDECGAAPVSAVEREGPYAALCDNCAIDRYLDDGAPS